MLGQIIDHTSCGMEMLGNEYINYDANTDYEKCFLSYIATI